MKDDVLAALERINSSSRLRAESTVSMSTSTPNMAAAIATRPPPATTTVLGI